MVFFYFLQLNIIFLKIIKKSYRSFNNIEEKIKIYADKLPILENDTKNIIEYVDQSNNKKKKKFNFWELLEGND